SARFEGAIARDAAAPAGGPPISRAAGRPLRRSTLPGPAVTRPTAVGWEDPVWRLRSAPAAHPRAGPRRGMGPTTAVPASREPTPCRPGNGSRRRYLPHRTHRTGAAWTARR